MLFNQSVIKNEKETIFLNRLALKEYNKIKNKIMVHMLEDLSKITGFTPEGILDDYIERNRTDIFIDVLKDEGRYTEEDEIRDHESLVMFKLKRVVEGGK